MREKMYIRKILAMVLLTGLLAGLAGCSLPWGKNANVKTDKPSVYQTVLAKQPVEEFQSCFFGGGDEIVYVSDERLSEFLDNQPDCNTMTLFLAWSMVEPEKDVYDFSEYKRVFDMVIEKGYKIITVIDAEGRYIRKNGEIIGDISVFEGTSIPTWVWEEYPEDQSHDFYGNRRVGLDLYSEKHIPEVAEFYEQCLSWLDENYKDHIYAITPGFQQENEIKFAQEDYCWESYTDQGRLKFQKYLENKYGTVDNMNSIHGASYGSFAEVQLPIVDYNNTVLVPNQSETFEFTDFMDFREQTIYDYAKIYTDIIHNHGYQTLGYFGQFMYPVDGIYATGVARRCSSIFDYAVIDYNFYDGYRVLYDSLVSAYMTNMMSNLGYSKVFTGLYFEKISLEGHEAFVEDLSRNILSDGHADGYEIGNLVLLNGDAAGSYQFVNPTEKNAVRSKIAIYNSEWNYYKTHGENADLMNYLNDSAVFLYDILQNKLGIPVEVITDQCVLAGNLNDFDLVFFPAQLYMADEEIACIREYLEQGGKIIQDFRFGDYNAYGTETDNKSLFGITAQGATGEAYTIEALGKGWPQQLEVTQVCENIPASYEYAYAEGGIPLYQRPSGENKVPVCIVSGNTMTWGFQPQLQYAESGKEEFCDFIYDSILYMERLK